MSIMVPFRQSSFIYGRRDSDGTHAAPDDTSRQQPDSGSAGSSLEDLQRGLLDGADVDVEICYDDTFVFSWKRLLLHVGPGALMCIAYVDPGNLEADLQTGATTGYQLLWVLFWSTTMGYLLQSLAARLGVATGKHLAEHCREQYPPGVRHVLWLMAELAIIGSDVQEVIGTAIALLLLSCGGVPLWGGVLLAAVAAYTVLFLERLGVRYLEVVFELLIAVMSVSMGLLFFMVDIPYAQVAKGLVVPHLTRSAIPTACGLLGAIIMPHNLFLHSALVHSRSVVASTNSGMPARRSNASKKESVLYYNIEAGLALFVTLFINVCVISVFAAGFFGKKTEQEIGLANAGEYLGATFGKHMTLIWAVGLLAAGQSSTMTGTYAGQFVMGGFLNLKMSAGVRMLVTRAVAICPTLLVALSARSDTTRLDVLNQWINILQSVQLPFAVIPLLLLTSDRAIMGPAFVNRPATAAVCWLIAAAIIIINGSAAFETLLPFLPHAWWLQIVFWVVVTAYVGFLVYLILTPEGAQRVAVAVSRSVSHWSLHLGSATDSSYSSLAGAPTQAAELSAPAELSPSPFEQQMAKAGGPAAAGEGGASPAGHGDGSVANGEVAAGSPVEGPVAHQAPKAARSGPA